MNIKDFKVGDEVFIRDYGYRNNESGAKMVPAVVTKVGKKIVYVKTSEYGFEYQFTNELDHELFLDEKQTARTENKLFRTMEDVELWKEGMELQQQIIKFFNWGGCMSKQLTLDQKRRICAILNER